MQFQINERIGFLYEKGGGVIKSFEENRVIVEDEDGFDRTFLLSEIIKIHGEFYDLPDDAVVQINMDDTISRKNHTVTKQAMTGSKKPVETWELDLHIENLVDSHGGMSNSQILECQMKELRNFYKRAKDKHIRKLIIIHGVGMGVLKEEVQAFLDKKEGVEHYDADFRDYGKGATAVEIRHNG